MAPQVDRCATSASEQARSKGMRESLGPTDELRSLERHEGVELFMTASAWRATPLNPSPSNIIHNSQSRDDRPGHPLNLSEGGWIFGAPLVCHRRHFGAWGHLMHDDSL